MKYHFFIDNFRGFSNTWIPIVDVNFLVGQNSTGKTSAMGLLKLFSGSRFLMNPRAFGDEHVDFGNFSEMVSIHSEDKSCFHVGLVWKQPSDTEAKAKAHTTAWLCTYLEDQGVPQFYGYSFYRNSRSVSIRFYGGNIYFKEQTYKSDLEEKDVINTLFPRWVEERHAPLGEYGKVDVGGLHSGPIPIFLVLAMIASGDPPKDMAKEIGYQITDAALLGRQEITWLAPIRAKPTRTYDQITLNFSPEGHHTPYLIRKALRSKKEAERFSAFFHKVGQSSGLFQDVQIKNFGKSVTAPFEVDIVIDGKALNLNTVGYGVSQSLPVLVEILARPSETWFAIQQPEVHLHPRAQAALGDVLFEMAVTEQKRFLIETHSDFTIDRFRMNYRNTSTDLSSQILFFERRRKKNVVIPIQISQSGELPPDQPDTYREFFVREEMRLLGDS